MIDSQRWMQLVAASSDFGWECFTYTVDDHGATTYTYLPRSFAPVCRLLITIRPDDKITGAYELIKDDGFGLNLDTRHMIKVAFEHGRTASSREEMLAWLLIDSGGEEDWPDFERQQVQHSGIFSMLASRAREIEGVLYRLQADS